VLLVTGDTVNLVELCAADSLNPVIEISQGQALSLVKSNLCIKNTLGFVIGPREYGR
jgi:hypothetical protein